MRGPELNPEKLTELIPQYAHEKEMADNYKKTSDALNKEIKDIMTAYEIKSCESCGYKVTKTVSNRETINQDLLLFVAKKYGLPVVKTVEVVDMDLLEKYLYDRELTDEQASDLAKCKTVTEVVTLRIKETK